MEPNIMGSHVHTSVVIVGAGPSGLATAACLKHNGIPFILIERSGCIASLWKERTYDSLHLHLSREYCSLPLMPIPEPQPETEDAGHPTTHKDNPTNNSNQFLSRAQFIEYLESYAAKFELRPRFNETVRSASFDEASQKWVIRASAIGPFAEGPRCLHNVTYIGRWLVVATGENSEPVLPRDADLPGLEDFHGSCIHSSRYMNAFPYKAKRVLVIGSGNSGMEIAGEVSHQAAKTSVVVRSPMHILPREVFGKSTFSVGIQLLKSFPVWVVDRFLVSYSRIVLGDTAAYGIQRPKIGPLELKCKMGKTPVLDVGTLAKIKSGDIKVKPAVERLTRTGVTYVDGVSEDFDAIIFATGYKSNVLRWLKDKEQFFGANGMPRSSCPTHWKGEKGLYVAGLGGKGVFGATTDAKLIVEDLCHAFNKVANLSN